MNKISDQKVFEMFPAARSEEVPPAPDHILYDLRIPAHASKLVTVGDARDPLLWFTWARPLRPIIPPVTGQHWIWVENGPHFWLIDMVWRRDLMPVRDAVRVAIQAGHEMGLIHDGEDVLFYRNGGRYGRIKARRPA